MEGTSRPPTVSTKLQRIAEQAKSYPEMEFTTLAHLMDVEWLREAFHRTSKTAAPGIDGVTVKQYAEHLEENLSDLHERLRNGQYRAMPVERVWIDKEDGKQRPIGKPVLEDKIVQRGVAMMLEAVYEQDFYDFSYGFRPGRDPHQALHALTEQCVKMNVQWIVDADISGFFDSVNHTHLVDILKLRVKDGGIIRLIGKWLNAGVLEGETLTFPDKGTPQGSVISPILANIYLHHVLDEWFVRDVLPRLKGRAFLLRFADDFIIGCEMESDARRILEVLPKRCNRFGLTIHPTKTKLVRFGRPPRGTRKDQQNGTLDFLGFTHYWGLSRQGNWVIKRKTAKKRLRRAQKAFWQWCRENRHRPIREQYVLLCAKLRGYYQYYGVRHNYRALAVVREFVVKAWRYWLARRTRTGRISAQMSKMLAEVFDLPRPRIVHAI
jgi:RNA-directed DNA polymerase